MNIPQNTTIIDHIVVVAACLEEGADFCESILGIRPQAGGQHAAMGTHNCLLNLDNEIYLEVIAINPAAAPPGRSRWFEMDSEAQREKLRHGPYLTTFVAACTDIASTSRSLPQLGPVHTMQRGSLNWLITIADDGALVDNGTVPALIQWPGGSHPTRNMPAPVCRLMQLEVGHPDPEGLRENWGKIGLYESSRLRIQGVDKNQAPKLVAHIDTPQGVKRLK